MTPDSSAISWLDESVALGAALAGAAMFGAACTVIGSMVTLFLVAKRKIVAEKRVVVRCDGCGAVVCTACGRICGHESRRPAEALHSNPPSAQKPVGRPVTPAWPGRACRRAEP